MTKSLIFLDIHGVLTNASSKFVYGNRDKLDPVSVRLIDCLASEYDAQIVLTSTLVQGLNIDDLIDTVKTIGGKRLVPHMAGVLQEGARIQRGNCLAAFLEGYSIAPPYVAIDDHPELYLPGQRVIGVDGELGFRLSDYNKAIAILGSA